MFAWGWPRLDWLDEFDVKAGAAIASDVAKGALIALASGGEMARGLAMKILPSQDS